MFGARLFGKRNLPFFRFFVRFPSQVSGRKSPESCNKPEKILKKGTYDKVRPPEMGEGGRILELVGGSETGGLLCSSTCLGGCLGQKGASLRPGSFFPEVFLRSLLPDADWLRTTPVSLQAGGARGGDLAEAGSSPFAVMQKQLDAALRKTGTGRGKPKESQDGPRLNGRAVGTAVAKRSAILEWVPVQVLQPFILLRRFSKWRGR